MEEVKKVKVQHGKFYYILSIFQIGFFAVIGIFTWYNSSQTSKNNKLIYKPVIGVTDVFSVRHYPPEKKDTYQDIDQVTFFFTVENVGNLPAKDVIAKVAGKLGGTTLALTPGPQGEKGITVVQRGKFTCSAAIDRNAIVRIVEGGEKLVYTIDISYSDWEGYEVYKYQTAIQVEVGSMEPLSFFTMYIA